MWGRRCHTAKSFQCTIIPNSCTFYNTFLHFCGKNKVKVAMKTTFLTSRVLEVPASSRQPKRGLSSRLLSVCILPTLFCHFVQDFLKGEWGKLIARSFTHMLLQNLLTFLWICCKMINVKKCFGGTKSERSSKTTFFDRYCSGHQNR